MKVFLAVLVLQVIVSVLIFIRTKRSYIFRLLLVLLLTVSMQNTLIFSETLSQSEKLNKLEGAIESKAGEVVESVSKLLTNVSTGITNTVTNCFQLTDSKLDSMSGSRYPISRLNPTNGPRSYDNNFGPDSVSQ